MCGWVRAETGRKVLLTAGLVMMTIGMLMLALSFARILGAFPFSHNESGEEGGGGEEGGERNTFVFLVGSSSLGWERKKNYFC